MPVIHAKGTLLDNNALQLTRRVGAAAARPVVEARLAAERGCSTDVELGGEG